MLDNGCCQISRLVVGAIVLKKKKTKQLAINKRLNRNLNFFKITHSQVLKSCKILLTRLCMINYEMTWLKCQKKIFFLERKLKVKETSWVCKLQIKFCDYRNHVSLKV